MYNRLKDKALNFQWLKSYYNQAMTSSVYIIWHCKVFVYDRKKRSGFTNKKMKGEYIKYKKYCYQVKS